MIYLAWVVSLVAVFWLGYKLNKLTFHVKKLAEKIEKKRDKPEPVQTVSDVVIDPLDPIQAAKFEHTQMMKKLNPDSDDLPQL